jgi:hypothetical protein
MTIHYTELLSIYFHFVGYTFLPLLCVGVLKLMPKLISENQESKFYPPKHSIKSFYDKHYLYLQWNFWETYQIYTSSKSKADLEAIVLEMKWNYKELNGENRLDLDDELSYIDMFDKISIERKFLIEKN